MLPSGDREVQGLPRVNKVQSRHVVRCTGKTETEVSISI
jgi:hypothetical protein